MIHEKDLLYVEICETRFLMHPVDGDYKTAEKRLLEYYEDGARDHKKHGVCYGSPPKYEQKKPVYVLTRKVWTCGYCQRLVDDGSGVECCRERVLREREQQGWEAMS